MEKNMRINRCSGCRWEDKILNEREKPCDGCCRNYEEDCFENPDGTGSKDCEVMFPYRPGTPVYGLAFHIQWDGRITYVPELCYYVSPYFEGTGHLIQELMGTFKHVRAA